MIAALCFTSPATAQTAFTLDARNGPPVAEPQINGRDVRLEVDTRVPDILAVSTPGVDPGPDRASEHQPWRAQGCGLLRVSSLRPQAKSLRG